jgi:hypothetical protein
MSTDQEHARLIAERVARRVAGSTVTAPKSEVNISAELSAVRASLSELEKKLARIESKVSGQAVSAQTQAPIGTTSQTSGARPVPLTHSPWLAGVNATAAHPSQERFGVEEAVVTELVDFFEKEKACSLETDKPCDHCEMCSSRGF